MSLTRPIAVLALALATAAPALAADTYKIDPVHTFVLFRVQHLGLSYAYGRFTDVNGSFAVDPAAPAESAAEITIRTDSVNTHDAKRDAHLKSPDFFNAKTFPVIRFVATQFEKGEGDTVRVTGGLTLHGVTRPLTFTMAHVGEGKDPWNGYRSGYEGEVTLKRSDYGMGYMVGPVGDEVTLTLAIEGIRQ